jgi:hypothetical protein
MQVVLEESGTRCGTSTTSDLKTIRRRYEDEGLAFLAITLPKFCSDFQKSLDQGFVARSSFSGFTRKRGLPTFLSGFLEHVFDRDSGRLLDSPCVHSIRSVRQITLLFGKIEERCSPRRVRAAHAKYIECEQDVRFADATLGSDQAYRLVDFERISNMLWGALFSSIDSRVYKESVLPKHGPGVTAEKLRGNAKYKSLEWTQRLEEGGLPHWEHLIPSESFLQRTDSVRILEPGDERPVRVIDVPKTLKTPRIIAVEPTCVQYMQQGVLEVIVQEIARDYYASNLVGFESQEPNQRLAREGSITGALATLDLSEASDRVSNQHVRLLLSRHKILRDLVDATRSRKADVPGFGVVRLAKFASMGSALCFPFEALVFTTIIFVGIERALKRPLTHRDVKSLVGKVRVYGDDIIVPTDYVTSVIEELEAFGLRVNSDKSYWTGRFRESCGKEFFDGADVSIARCRRTFPESTQHVSELTSIVSLRNQMFHLNYSEVVRFLDPLIERIIPFPYGTETSALLVRHDHYLPCQETRHDLDLHRPLVRGAYVESKLASDQLDDYGALMKWFLKRGDQPFEDRNHLERAGRPVSARIKIRWAPPY